MLCMFSWLSLFIDQRSSLNCPQSSPSPFYDLRQRMWNSLAAFELWDLGTCWLLPDWVPGPLSTPRRKPGSHGPRSEAGRREHLRQHLHPAPHTQPVRWPSSTRGSSPGIAESHLPFCWRITPAGTQSASWIFLFSGLCKAGRERIRKGNENRRIQVFVAELAEQGGTHHRKSQSQWIA